MKQTLFLWLLTLGSVVAQPQRINKVFYRGNPEQIDVILNAADSLLPVTALAKYSAGGSSYAGRLQPYVGRRAGNSRQAVVFFSAEQTAELLDAVFVEIRVGSVVRASGLIPVTKRVGSGTGPPAAPGSINVGTILPGAGNQSWVIRVENVASGTIITHNLGTKLIIGECFRSDTGGLDPLWKLDPIDDNRGVLRGPPNELFSGSAVATGYKNLTN